MNDTLRKWVYRAYYFLSGIIMMRVTAYDVWYAQVALIITSMILFTVGLFIDNYHNMESDSQ